MSDFILKTANIFYLSTRIHRYATTGHYVTFSNLSKKGLQWPRICQLSRVFIRPSSWNMIQSSGYATDRIYFMSFIPISWMRFYRSKIASDLVTRIYIKQGFWPRTQFFFYGTNLFLSLFYIEIAVHGYRPRRSGLAGFGTAKPAQSAPGSTTAIDDLSAIISLFYWNSFKYIQWFHINYHTTIFYILYFKPKILLQYFNLHLLTKSIIFRAIFTNISSLSITSWFT